MRGGNYDLTSTARVFYFGNAYAGREANLCFRLGLFDSGL